MCLRISIKKIICKVLATAVALQTAMSVTPSFAAAEQQGVAKQSINSATKTGWLQEGNKRYYLQKDGTKKKGWLQLEGKTYYFDSNGVMQTGTILVDDGLIYNFNIDGSMKTGWIDYNGSYWRYLYSDGSSRLLTEKNITSTAMDPCTKDLR